MDGLMHSNRKNPLAAVLLLVVLTMIAVILILPQVDLPDTAFQRNSSPVAIHTLSHHVLRVTADAEPFRISFPPAHYVSDCTEVPDVCVQRSQGPPIQSDSLRC